MPVKNPDLLPLFEEAKVLLEPMEEHFTATSDGPGRYELSTREPISFEGRPAKQFFFVGLIVQKHYVGFYFMPIYIEPDLVAKVGPDLRPLLKGKSCFYLKKMTPEIAEQLSDALEMGRAFYADRGWA